MMNHSLKRINISQNYIGDNGITVFSGAINSSSQISSLDISECGIHLIGARAIARLITRLLANGSLEFLDLSGNHFTGEGMSIILQSALDSGFCCHELFCAENPWQARWCIHMVYGNENHQSNDVQELSILFYKR